MLGQGAGYVYCADIDLPGANAVASQIGVGRAAALCFDVTDSDGWARSLEAIQSRGHRLNVVVHAAGVAAASPLMETSLEAWRSVMAVNLDGSFLAVRHGIAAMQEQGGVIVLVGSASGIRPAAGAAAYSTSKAAVSMLARAAAKECRETGIPVRVNVVSPGGVTTSLWRSLPFFQEAVARLGSEAAAFAVLAGSGPRFATAEEVAQVITFLASPAAGQIAGVELPVDAGYVL